MGTCRPGLLTKVQWKRAWKQKLNKSVSFNYYFFDCTLKDTLTAKNGDVSSSTTQVKPESLICTRDDKHFSTFAYRSCPWVLKICRLRQFYSRLHCVNLVILWLIRTEVLSILSWKCSTLNKFLHKRFFKQKLPLIICVLNNSLLLPKATSWANVIYLTLNVHW